MSGPSNADDGADYQSRYEELKKLYDKLLFEHERLRRRLLGPKRERIPPSSDQLSFSEMDEMLKALGLLPADGDESGGADTDEELAAQKRAARNAGKAKKPNEKPRRRDVSTLDLPVEEVVLEPAERSLPGGDELIKIGEEVSEHVDRKPATVVRVRVVRPKYKRPTAPTVDEVDAGDEGHPRPGLGAPLGRARRQDGPTIIIAALPERPISGGLAGPGLLAHTLVSKYGDHLPWYRLSSILEREGLKVARSTLSDWVEGSVELLAYITKAMWDDAKRNARYIIVDATGVLVQAKEECRRRSFYVLVVPGEHVLFRYTKKNDGPSVAELFEGFTGYVHADAASVYHELYRNEPTLIEVGCWSHARRGFFEAYTRDKDRALTGIGYIGQLYDAHRASLDDDGNVDAAKRCSLARPILAKLFRWIRRERRLVKEGTPIHAALGYIMRQRKALLRFLDDGQLRMDTNLAEGELRRVAKGRDNWLFCASDEGARWNTVVVSLIASCKVHGVEPWAYLRDVLTLLPVWDQTRVLELAPKEWAQTCARPETLALLREQRLLGRDEA